MTQGDERQSTTVVSQRVTMECVGDGGTTHRVDTSFGYDLADPYAVTLTFHTAAGDIPWRFARELLVHGLISPMGEGDVHVWPSVTPRGRSVLIIELASPDGWVRGELRAEAIYRFLTHSLQLVPLGEEGLHLDLDTLLARLLAV